ncbi:MAG: radical SAM protein [Acidobacteria bacterium]|nr:radical SAM protein [Acidobacteriota bacterium]
MRQNLVHLPALAEGTIPRNADSVFAVPVGECWLIHVPLAGTGALVNESAVSELRRHTAGLPARIPPALADLLKSEENPPGPRTGRIEPLFLGLLPTRACNMACVYCGFGSAHAHEGTMKPETAVRAIDWAAERAAERGGETLDVHLFGGEPLLETELVDIIVHRTRAAAAEHGLAPVLETATNGTCDETFARFVGDHFHAVVVSFDGFREVQNRCRPMKGGRPSFEKVCRTVRIWRDSPVKLCLRICVTADNMSRLGETVDWYASEFQPAVIACETIQSTPESRSAGLAPPDPLLFARAFWEARGRCAKAGIEIGYGASLPARPRATFCPVGQDAVIVSPDGRVSACYMEQRDWQSRGLDLDFGAVDARGVRLDLEALEGIRALARPRGRCERCFCRWSCAGSCHVTQSFLGCAETYNDMCRQNRLITACELLEEMGQGQLAAWLLEDRSAAMRLASERDDTLAGWEAHHG